MCRVKKFLCCVSLETFGLVYGWINFAVLVICAVLGTIKTAHFIVTSRLYLAGAGIFLVIIIMFTLIGYVILSFVRGVKSRDYKEMKAFRMLSLISILLLIIRLVTCFEAYMKDEESSEYHLAFSILSIVVNSYFFTCINSIVMIFEDEKFPIDYPELVEVQAELRHEIAELPPYNPNWRLQKAINNRISYRQQQIVPLGFDNLVHEDLF